MYCIYRESEQLMHSQISIAIQFRRAERDGRASSNKIGTNSRAARWQPRWLQIAIGAGVSRMLSAARKRASPGRSSQTRFYIDAGPRTEAYSRDIKAAGCYEGRLRIVWFPGLAWSTAEAKGTCLLVFVRLAHHRFL